MISAPARLMLVSVSIITRCSSIQPFLPAALIIEYSPLTLYAAVGIPNCLLRAGRCRDREAPASPSQYRSFNNILLYLTKGFVGIGRVIWCERRSPNLGVLSAASRTAHRSRRRTSRRRHDGILWKLFLSRICRIALTRPSNISEGATISAPACTCVSASFARSSIDSSLII